MWLSYVLTTTLSLAPAQAGDLKLTNSRVTYGLLGQERPDSKSPKLLPGDVYLVSFDITGLTAKKDGRVQYSMGMELTRKGKKKPEFKKDPADLEALNTLGGNRLPSYALWVIGTDVPADEYTLKVTVKDRISKQEAVLTKKFEVVPVKLGLVRLGLSYDTGAPAPPVGVPGQTFLLSFSLVGFTLDKKKAPNVSVEVRVLDEDGRPTVAEPFKGEVKAVDAKFAQFVPFEPIPIHLNRAGKFTIVLKVTDNLTTPKRTAEERLEFTVMRQGR
jgi:hypothetical protein